MNKNTVGVIFSNIHDESMPELTGRRTTASVPFGGRYRLIDFALSNMINAGIIKIGVITKNNYQSLMDHLGSGKDWDLSRKRGGLFLLPPFSSVASGMYHSRVEALAGIRDFLDHCTEETVVLSDCDVVANFDLSALTDRHTEQETDVTVLYKCMPAMVGEAVYDIQDGRLAAVLTNNEAGAMRCIAAGGYILRRSVLLRLIDEATVNGLSDFQRDCIGRNLNRLRVEAVELPGLVMRINSLSSYYANSMQLLRSDVREALFPEARPVFTKRRDNMPTKYGAEAVARGCLVAGGCEIAGRVENSVIFRDVRIAKGAVVKNCILMQGTVIEADSNLSYVIADKNVVIRGGRTINGFETFPVFIGKGNRV